MSTLTDSALIELDDLKITIPTAQGRVLQPVRGIALSVKRGETLAIVGESGCGKSLTALSLMGLVPKPGRVDAARLSFDGQPLIGLREAEWRKLRGPRIAMIFQDPMTSLDPCYTIGSQMTEVMRTHLGIGRTQARERAVSLLARVGIPSPAARLEQYPHQLSGGLRQRVMIAMALSCEPDLIIADEPTTALDVTTQAQILGLLAQLQDETGVGIILITHDLGVVATMAHRVAVMYAGQVVETGDTAEVLTAPAHPYTEGLLQAIPTPGRTARGALLGSIAGIVPPPTGEVKACLFMERCPYARPVCAAPVPLLPQDGDRALRCIRPVAERVDEPGFEEQGEVVS
ncbi:peptide ABC transporter substrate-binding protein [Bosea sp. Root381]|uniref:ABC transporter ATP-binding protein n=1 Tax=Bosea sp. Root381 TaxID=1736524 RepID=UPI0007014D6C|nr:ABC transporter ATP-binding protein [Bosea sp. Root381]KRE07416.1 peptide ABC transporter substrate-binding protein [Bosea sp. Root381]